MECLCVFKEVVCFFFFFFKQKTAYEMCGRDWSSDVCSSDLGVETPCNLIGHDLLDTLTNCLRDENHVWMKDERI